MDRGWLSLHPSRLFAGELARFALRLLEGLRFEEGPGFGEIRFTEGSVTFQVMVEYYLEQFPGGRVFHLISIRSPGDPPRAGLA